MHFAKKLNKLGHHTIAVDASDSDDDTADERGETKYEAGGVTYGLSKGKKDQMIANQKPSVRIKDPEDENDFIYVQRGCCWGPGKNLGSLTPFRCCNDWRRSDFYPYGAGVTTYF
jgi:hypothetical protein